MDAALPWPWPTTRNANNRSKVRVGTTSRSMAAIACAWLRKNVFQPCDGDPPRTMYFETARLDHEPDRSAKALADEGPSTGRPRSRASTVRDGSETLPTLGFLCSSVELVSLSHLRC